MHVYPDHSSEMFCYFNLIYYNNLAHLNLNKYAFSD